MFLFYFNIIVILLSLWPVSSAFARAQVMAAGAEESAMLLRRLAVLYRRQNSQFRVVVPDGIGSGGGIRALLVGKTDLARTVRPLREGERKGLREVLFAGSPIVFALHPAHKKLRNLSVKELLGVYTLKVGNWRELKSVNRGILPVDRERSNPARLVLVEKMSGFGGRSFAAKTYYSPRKALYFMRTRKYSIGFFSLAAARKNRLRILAVDGVRPTEKNVRRGSYRYVLPFYVVGKSVNFSQARGFVRFLFSGAAKQAIRKMGYVPLGSVPDDSSSF